MTPLPWFRVYANDLLTDRKIKRICKRTGQSKALVIGIWIILLCLANDSPDRGHLNIAADMPYTIDDLEDETGLPPEVMAQLFDEFRSHGMINGNATIQISNWDKRQYKSDNVTERVRAYREKRSAETLPKRSNNVIDTDTDTDTDTEVAYFPRFISAQEAQAIYTSVTTFATFPSGSRANDIERIYAVSSQHPTDTVEYLKPYYQEWIRRKYNKSNTNWLDWAVTGEIPADKKKVHTSVPTEEF